MIQMDQRIHVHQNINIFRYANIDEMWRLEFENDPRGRVMNRVGSKDNWYQKAADYWEVGYFLMALTLRKQKHLILESLVDILN